VCRVLTRGRCSVTSLAPPHQALVPLSTALVPLSTALVPLARSRR